MNVDGRLSAASLAAAIHVRLAALAPLGPRRFPMSVIVFDRELALVVKFLAARPARCGEGLARVFEVLG
jgi:hypothetical protein